MGENTLASGCGAVCASSRGCKRQKQALADLGHKGTRWEDAGWLRAVGGRVEREGLGKTGLGEARQSSG